MKSVTRHSFSICILILLTAAFAMAQKMKPEEVVAKHLDSIGTPDARAAAKSMMAVGDAVVTFISQKNQTAVTEDFSYFKVFNGLTLPQKYKLNYTISGANGTTEVEWAYALNEFAFNQPMDDKTFDADAK